MKIAFSKPNPGDLGWVISMHGKIYSQDFKFNPQFEIDIARKLVSFFDKSNDFNLFLISLVDGNRAGSIAISKESQKIAFVNFVLVTHKFRGQGIAKRMMREVINHAQHQHVSKLRLETYSCLKNARKLYKDLGFYCIRSNKNLQKYGQFFDQEFWELDL
ncbi:MAG: GNAT family N-acetyltransferase [Leptolyngbya sp. SIO3F4]|nr:GNAT family N-acetyltransferase [Leptolyngbya sp. SIO3F4]